MAALKRQTAVLAAIVLIVAVRFDLASAQPSAEALKALDFKNPEHRSKLAEGAKKEGKLVFYGTLGVDASRPFLELFRKSHPYISIDHYRSNEGGIYNKVAIEASAGKHSADVIESASLTAANLIDRGLIDPYNSPESAAIRAEFVDPKRL